jgi:hypothetical protein
VGSAVVVFDEMAGPVASASVVDGAVGVDDVAGAGVAGAAEAEVDNAAIVVPDAS